ncbi:MAG: PilZ domain-containing protein [Gemmatimonadetes bacterium]|nr:PilZ domain-containing protein [Gemmatimonadota bacterium]
MDERRTSRVALGIRAEVWQGRRVLHGHVVNLSLGGVAVALDALVPVGECCTVTLMLDGGADSPRCTLEATVVRSGPTEADLALTAVVGLDGMEHLRQLVLFNASEPDRVAGEFERFVGLRPRD